MSIKKFICAAVLVSFAGLSVTGCYGHYALFNKVLKWNGKMGGKVMQELVYLVFWILPVYEICIFADWLIFNTLEFWTGSNPMAMGNTYEEMDANGNKVYAVKNPDGTLSVNLVAADGKTADFMLERNGNTVRVIDSKSGSLMAMQTMDNDGNVLARAAFDLNGVAVAENSAAEGVAAVAVNAAQ
ncbi:MAG: DUF3332 domain-containing protein [Chitinispirillales bacterium]|jgi:hypothetical protein|nr:DUF3332 domain-containing protein [Chitinispirillales bacterium]